ncbi:DUF485 domain-containing protein [Rhodococcus ruber]|uniref:DUF485 domain-containing protein n=1 Tax=Rhodococcus ruber TaxID=1830 RepID=A0ABT4MM52_9NOCA|nr:DUF485 domain-containing protein [Rhodococcus ruber]MCZ4521749.1 DUF485 domain-containing protein [Rhodococcus ruber]
MARTIAGSIPPEAETGVRAHNRSTDIDTLLTRRRKLLMVLGIPAVLCTLAYVGLLIWGRGTMSIAIGELNVGWVITFGSLLVGPVICTIYGQLSTSHLDPLRERIAASRSSTFTSNGAQ